MTYLKSVGSVLAGLIVIFVLSMATDFVLQNAGIIPRNNLYVAAPLIVFVILYRIVFSIIGCYITARLAPRNPMYHALALGVVGVIISTMGAVANSTMNLGPAWYAWSLVILAMPAAWLGGRIYVQISSGALSSIISHKAKPASAGANQITITRMIDAPRQKVWAAWTKPEILAQWWGVPPLAAKPETTSIDLRVGGAWRADMVNSQDGTRIPFGGKYIEIKSPHKLVFTIEDASNPQNPNVETVTITFKDRVGTTEMIMHQEGHLPKEQYGDPLRNGYNAFFDRMISMIRITI